VPTITIDSSAVTLELSDTTRNIDEDLHNSGRRIAFNGDGDNVADGTENTSAHHASVTVNDGSLTDFDGWSLEVSGTPADTGTHQLRLLVGERSGVFDVDYDVTPSIKPITYYADATYSGINGDPVDAGSTGIEIGTVDMSAGSSGKNGSPLVIELNSNATEGMVEELVSHIALTVRDNLGNQTEDWGAVDAVDPTITFELFNSVSTTSDARPVNLISQAETGTSTNDIFVSVTSWKGGTNLGGVILQSGVETDVNGSATISTDAAATFLNLTPDLAMSTAEQEEADAAVGLLDAIAILKMVVGLPVNEAGTPLSPYQSIAADFDADGTVGLLDAIDVLKHVVDLPTTGQVEWGFVEVGTTVSEALEPGQVDVMITSDVASTSVVELVGVLRGDVDGSWDV